MSAPDSFSETVPPKPLQRSTARAILLGDRLDVTGLERSDAVSAVPLAFRVGADGFAALFRHGVVVTVGLSPVEEDELLRGLKPRVTRPFERLEDETAQIVVDPEKEDHVPPGGPVRIRDLSPERVLVVADALAKSVALARDERGVAAVFDVIEPLAERLARTGRAPADRRAMKRIIGEALLVQHRTAGRVAAQDKPDVLWDRPDLERLYQRLEGEYELGERAQALARKLAVIDETARALTDLIDTERSLRLEVAIVLLIVFEILITFYEMWAKR